MRMHPALAVIALWLALAGISGAEELYVTGFTTGKIYHTISGSEKIKTIPMTGNPFDAVLSADEAFLYVSQPGGNSVSVVRTSDDALVAVVDVQSSPRKIAIGNNDTRLYVTNNAVAGPHVIVVDITPQPGGGRKNAMVDSIDLTSQGANSAYTVATFGDFLAVGTESGHVLLYDTSVIPARFIGKREIGVRVKHIVFSPLGTKLYALLATPCDAITEDGTPASPGNLEVLRFPSLAVKAVLSLGTGELRRGVVVHNSCLYVTDARGNLHAIDTETDTLLGTTNLGEQLSALTATETKVFATDPVRSVVRTIIPGGHPPAGRSEGTILLENGAVPVGLVVLNRVARQTPGHN